MRLIVGKVWQCVDWVHAADSRYSVAVCELGPSRIVAGMNTIIDHFCGYKGFLSREGGSKAAGT
jgi:hypothetical protein